MIASSTATAMSPRATPPATRPCRIWRSDPRGGGGADGGGLVLLDMRRIMSTHRLAPGPAEPASPLDRLGVVPVFVQLYATLLEKDGDEALEPREDSGEAPFHRLRGSGS